MSKQTGFRPSKATDRKRIAEFAKARAAKIAAIEAKFMADKAAIVAANPGADNSSAIKRLEWTADDALKLMGTHLFANRQPQASYDAYNSNLAWGN